MTLESVILKGLERGRGKPIGEVARIVAGYIEIARELESGLDAAAKMVDPPPGVFSPALPLPSGHVPEAGNLVVLPSTAPPPARITASDAERPKWTVEQMVRALDAAPAEITIKPAGFESELRLFRKVVRPPMDEMGVVRLIYTIPSADDSNCPQTQFSIYDETVDIEQGLREIHEQAMARFSAEKRVLKARRSAAPSGPVEVEAGNMMINADQVWGDK